MSQETNIDLTVWNINGYTFNLDTSDADEQDRLTECYTVMQKTEEKLVNIGKTSDITRGYCQLFYDFFDELFGEGTSGKLFDGKKSARLCDEVYDSFLQFIQTQTIETTKRRATMISKYAPNREQKRAKTSTKKGL